MHVDCGPYRVIDKRTRVKDIESLEVTQMQYGMHIFQINPLILTSCQMKKIECTMLYCLSGTLMHENHKKKDFAVIALEGMMNVHVLYIITSFCSCWTY
jgi:hypothetical protein